MSDLYNNEEYKELEYNSISLQDSEIDAKIISIGEMINQEDFELIMRVKALYDWSLLADILKGEEYISKGKLLYMNNIKRI